MAKRREFASGVAYRLTDRQLLALMRRVLHAGNVFSMTLHDDRSGSSGLWRVIVTTADGLPLD